MKKMLHRLRWISMLWALAVMLLAESPAVLIIGFAARIKTTQEINQLGILVMVRFMLLAAAAFGLGLLLFIRLKNANIRLSQWDFQRWEKLKKGRTVHLIASLLFALLPLFTIAEPAVNHFTGRGLEAEIIEAYWTWLFLVAAAVITIVAFSLIRFALVGRFQYEVDETLPEPKKKTKKKTGAAFAAAVLILVAAVAVMRNGSWLLQPYISTIPAVEHRQHAISYDASNGVYSIHAGEEDFRILQLTDIHLGGSVVSVSKDRAALEAVYTLVEAAKPDFIIITGDSVFPLGIMSFSLNNYVPMVQLASFLRNLGIPWAITFGNHDTEDIATGSEADISQVFDKFSFAKTRSLLYPEIQPPITGRSNQMILLKNSDGSIRQALFLMDSNDYQSNAINDYDYIHDDQVAWYKESLLSLESEYGQMPDSLLFFHIPLQEYQIAYDLYKAGSGHVEYHFGVVGEENEAICTSNIHSSLFDTAVKLGSTKGIFCGHDHYNNISLTYEGIRLTYGMSIDYLAMPGIVNRHQQRGGTLITIHKDASFDVEQLPLYQIVKGIQGCFVYRMEASTNGKIPENRERYGAFRCFSSAAGTHVTR